MTERKRSGISNLFIPEEKRVLEELYLFHRVPTDQLGRNPAILQEITFGFGVATGRYLPPELLLHYMINRRKDKQWPKLGNNYKKFRNISESISDFEYDILKNIYISLGVSVDQYQYRPDLRDEISKEFYQQSKRYISGIDITVMMLEFRKDGTWPTFEEKTKVATPFSDIDEVIKKWA